MIYLDSSVALAHLLVEGRRPSASLWADIVISGRLLEYEVWCRLHPRDLASSHGEAARQLLGPHLVPRAVASGSGTSA